MNVARGLFVPKGYPRSVAEEYATYQAWDTMQQGTYFVNTVISAQAIMRFHGVGDPTRTAVEAAALELGRGAIAEAVSFFARVPAMTERYKANAAGYRLLAEIFNACGHFMEIMAAIFAHVAVLVYGGPMVINTSNALNSASRSVILQHFARVGNNGDVSLKESNQDKGGKIIGCVVGLVLLGTIAHFTVNETESLHVSAMCFLGLSVVHILGNVAAVKQLQIEPPSQEEPFATDGDPAPPRSPGMLRAMFLPPSYPTSVAPEYTAYRAWSLLATATDYPKLIVMSMAFWHGVYGVGDGSRTALQAVLINVFLVSVDAVVGLISGLPIITERLNYAGNAWKLRSGLLGRLSECLRLAAALSPPWLFFPLVILSVVAGAFGGTSGKYINAEITRNWSRAPQVGLVDLGVTSSNQDLLVRSITAAASVGYLYSLVERGAKPLESLALILPMYGLLQLVCVGCEFGQYRNLPDEAPYVQLKKDMVHTEEVAMHAGTVELAPMDTAESMQLTIEPAEEEPELERSHGIAAEVERELEVVHTVLEEALEEGVTLFDGEPATVKR